MKLRTFRSFATISAAVLCLLASFAYAGAAAQSSSSSTKAPQGSSSPGYQQEKAPSLCGAECLRLR
jgi:hypothetical protein